jgi:predicted AlkP superfamily phosphohydrolase/phosphomutase
VSEDNPRRVVLVGLDGATFSVLNPLMEDGTMPFLKEFTTEGVHGILYSTPHPLTPPAWTSLMTGRSPGNHGVFDFVRAEWRGDRPGYTLATSADNRCETIWSIASRQGCRVSSLNFPCMFPPPHINGFVVPGFVPWSYLSRAVYPADLYPRLKAQPEFKARELAMDWGIERKALQGLREEEFDPWIRFHIAREQQWFGIVKYLMQEEPCHLTAVLFDGVDKLQHLCYHLLDPHLASRATSAWARHIRSLCLEYFRQLDGFLAQIAAMAGDEARVFIASDHGFTAAGDQIFYANVWLQQHGYLNWADGVPLDEEGQVTLEGFTETGTLFNWDRTTAAALTASSNAIYIRQSRAPDAPGVPADEYPAFRERLIESLLAFADPKTGQPVIERVLTREEAFPGNCVEDAPDLTLVLPDRSLLSVLRADAPIKQRRSPYGTHHPHGIFFGRGPGIRTGVEIPPFPIVGITPTLLYSLGLPVPKDMEGAVAISAFEPVFVEAHPIDEGTASLSTETPHDAQQQSRLEADEEAQVLERLRALGYL